MGNLQRLQHGNFEASLHEAVEAAQVQQPTPTTDEILQLRRQFPPRYAAPLGAQIEMAYLNGDDDIVADGVALLKKLGK